MIAMQYNIALPSEYDMHIIRQRVQSNGSKTDGFPGLAMKAYLIAEKARYNNYENQYAPFYLWEKTEGMNQFLLGGPFNNILHSFGRPLVHHWIALHAHVHKTAEPQFALIQTDPIPASSDFASMLVREKDNFSSWAADPATKAYITAYNPFTCSFCRFHMATDLDMLQKTAQGALIYDVHHIS